MDIRQAKDELNKGYRAFKAFEFAVETLRILEISEQTAKEHSIAIAKAKEDLAELEKDIGDASGLLQTICEESEKERASAKAASLEIRSEAEADAVLMRIKAKEFLEETLSGKDEASLALKELNSILSEKRKELAALEESINNTKKAMAAALNGL